jgi:hypothetical protein
MCRDEQWELSLEVLSKNNDVIAVKVQDDWEKNPTPLGWVYTSDAEKEGCSLVHFDQDTAEEWERRVGEEKQRLKKTTTMHDIGFVEIDEGYDPLGVLRAYFERRCRILKR